MVYADDLYLVARSFTGLERSFVALHRAALELVNNETKTKYMYTRVTGGPQGPQVALEPRTEVGAFIYL